MRIFLLSVSNIVMRPLNTSLSLLLLALGVGMISLVLQIDRHVQDKMSKNIRDIDMVIGAKGSPLQLILSAVYHIDAPTGNIDFTQAQKLLKNGLIEFGIPLSYGDSHNGYRIVGTNHKYIELYGSTLLKGELWSKPFEVTIGSVVSKRLDLQIGDTFSGAHGLTDGGEIHENDVYKVVGILKQSNSVLDQLILTSSQSVWDTHHDSEEDHQGEHDEHKHEHEADEQHREITAMLIGFRSPTALIQIPRMINERTSMQAAVPAYEIDRLFGLMGVSVQVIKYIALIIMIVSGLSIFISLYSSLKERHYELALMRTFGATRLQLLWVILQEGLMMTLVGFLFGITCGRIGLFSVSALVETNFHYSLSIWNWAPEESLLFMATVCIGLLASIFPAVQAFRLNISRTLADA